MVQIEAYRLKERLTSVEDGGCREQAWQSPTSLPAMVVEGVAGSWNKAMWSQCLVGPKHSKEEKDLEEKNHKYNMLMLLR
ncbi:uncharacterized protein DS421_8g232190 [Arachis hypogaea]|nr:uncharacterized protein DS421_8g232190 [Arachis hypogaea]